MIARRCLGVTVSVLLVSLVVWRVGTHRSGGERTYSDKDLLCGPRSLHIAMRRLGIGVEFDALKESCSLEPGGASIVELARLAADFGAIAEVKDLTWGELMTHDGACVLFVDGDHFVAVDPRERASENSSNENLRVYDPDSVAQWYEREKFSTRWRGESLLLRRKAVAENKGPAVQFRSCWEDVGFINGGQERVRYSIDVTNVGAEPLELSVLGSSCSCTTAENREVSIPPAETQSLAFDVNLRGKRGSFLESVVLRSNDPRREMTRIFFAGSVFPNTLASKDIVYFGSLVQGETSQESIFVHNPGVESFNVESVQVDDAVEGVSISAQILQVDEKSDRISRNSHRYPIEFGDFEVRLTLSTDERVTLGRIRSRLLIKTNLSGNLAEFPVELACNVLADKEIVPAAIAFEVGSTTEKVEKIVCIQRRLRGDMQADVEDVKVPPGLPVTVRRTQDSERASIQLVISCTSSASPDASTSGTIQIDLTDGTVLYLPVAVSAIQ